MGLEIAGEFIGPIRVKGRDGDSFPEAKTVVLINEMTSNLGPMLYVRNARRKDSYRERPVNDGVAAS